jgi:hypothetical protein
MSAHRSVGVVGPAFRGNEVDFALQRHASAGCTFLDGGRCQLYGTGLQPLECRYCHHDRPGLGSRCHEDIGRAWDSPEGRALVVRWAKLTGFWDRLVLRASGPSGRQPPQR